MSQEKFGNPDQPPYYTPTANPPPSFGNTNYGFDNTGHGSAGSYPMNPPAGIQGSRGHVPSAPIQTSNVVISQVGAATGPVYNMPPQDYTTQAWLVCLLCFWPTGIMAILRANDSRDCLARGDLAGAHSAANSARQMIKISLIIGIVSLVVAGIIVGVTVGVVINNLNNIYYYD